MPSPLQTASSRRKVVYLGLILGLFVVNTFFWRGMATTAAETKKWPWTVQARAANLELTEDTQGEPDLLGSTVRLVLTGSRGLAVTILWQGAIEKQKRNEWNELEFIVRSLTKLQPHFLTPWLFQSWNLSYNVSVESDRVKDKYFYITRGIELLAQGERLNRDNPDMRYWLGFYFQNKFGVSDENSTLRSLYQLSCIPPEQRNPDLIAPLDPQTRRRKVDEKKFEEFCRQHPQLIRRLREPPKELLRPFKCNSPEEVVEFLADSRRLPSRFLDADDVRGQLLAGRPGDLKPQDQQFPTLPPAKPVRYSPNESQPVASDSANVLDDSFDAFTAARAWFSYAQDPLPEPEPMSDLQDRKERIKARKDRRIPRQPAELLFRQSPCRSQSYVGERLHKEGWFDDGGWSVDAGRSGLGRWFPHGRGDVVLGTGRDYATEAWGRAFRMWRDFGESEKLLLSKPEEINLEQSADKFRNRYLIDVKDPALVFRPDTMSPEMRAAFYAQQLLAWRAQNLQTTNFTHHYVKAEAEQDRETALARKTIDRAETARRAAEPERAIEEFQKGFEQWKQVFVRHTDFRDDVSTQEEVYETEVHYLDLIQDHRGEQIRPALAIDGITAAVAGAASGGGVPLIANGLVYSLVTDGRALPLPVLGPMDGTDNNGRAWITVQAVMTVRQRLNQEAVQSQPAPPPQRARTGSNRGG
jgi:hypothetical protein